MLSESIGIHDRMAIHDLLSRYCHAMDASRADLCIALFAAGASIHTPVGDAEGREAILKWIEGRLALRSPDYQVGHFLLNTLMTALNPTTVRARSMHLYTRQRLDASGATELVSTGIYEDEVRKSSSGWQFYSRCFSIVSPLDDAYFLQ